MCKRLIFTIFFTMCYSVWARDICFAFSICIDIRYIEQLETREYISCFSIHHPLLSITSHYTEWNVVNDKNDRTHCLGTTVYTTINTCCFWKTIYVLRSTKKSSLAKSSYLRTWPNDNYAKLINVDILLCRLNLVTAKHLYVLMYLHAV